MYIRSLIAFILVISSIIGVFRLIGASEEAHIPLFAWIGCDGNAVTRTEVGKIVMTKIPKNLPNCKWPKSIVDSVISSSGVVSKPNDIKTNSGYRESIIPNKKIVTNKILLDLSQKDIVNYRVKMIQEEQIRYANAIRSLRIRSGKSLEANTSWYLMRNDAVQVTGQGHGWTPVRSWEVVVSDMRENTISIDTATGTAWYVGTKWLRNATPSDLVKIGQADIAYWTDIVHTNVVYRVNIRSNPWYTASIVATVGKDVQLYRVATIDNWSQVQTIDGTIKGFIRSDFITIDKLQLIEAKPLLK